MRTIDGFNARAIGVRVYLLKDLVEQLSELCDQSNASISTVINAALKVALKDSQSILEDAKGVSNKWQSRK